MPIILIATDNTEDAKVVKHLLASEYHDIFTSTNPDTMVQDFESHLPDVLVLAFNTLEKAERYNLGLYRLSSLVHIHPHRTIILCNKDEIKQAYKLCKKEYFDDYIHFWPMTHDAPRLTMAVHHAMRSLTAVESNPSTIELADQAAGDEGQKALLEQNVAQGNERMETANHSIAQAEQGVQALHLKSASTLKATAEKIPTKILVVDDDELARKLLKTILTQANYEPILATSGDEALNLLHQQRPDLILMDMMMPHMDGMETTRRIKATDQFSTIPVIMVTGNSEIKVITDCLKAGAVDFVVKPYDRNILLGKVSKFLL